MRVKQIFVVEDHPVMRAAYAAVLARESGLELCGSAESAEAAREAIHPDHCDLVVIDAALPGMSGIELVRHLRAAYPQLPLIMASGNERRVLAQKAISAGASAYLDKKDLPSKLVSTIRQVLNSMDEAGRDE